MSALNPAAAAAAAPAALSAAPDVTAAAEAERGGAASGSLTLRLDEGWDLCLDARGNLALLSGSAAVCQSVCNALRLFEGDVFFEPARGIPHLRLWAGAPARLTLARAQLCAAALAVEGVAEAQVAEFTPDRSSRTLRATMELTLADGSTAVLTDAAGIADADF